MIDPNRVLNAISKNSQQPELAGEYPHQRQVHLAALAVEYSFTDKHVVTNALSVLDLPQGAERGSIGLSRVALANALRLANLYSFAVLPDGSLYDGEITIEDWHIPEAFRGRIESVSERPRLSQLLETSSPTADRVRQYYKNISQIPLLTSEEEVELAKKIEAGLFALHRLPGGRAYRGEQLSDEECQALAQLAHEGLEAKNDFFEANLRLVPWTIKGMGSSESNLSQWERIQEGNLGLAHAIEKFDYTKGFKFSTYAPPWIKNAVVRGEQDQSRTVRLPVHLWEKRAKIKNAHGVLKERYGRPATDEEVAEHTGLPFETIQQDKEIWQRNLSLDFVIDTDGREITSRDFLVDKNPLPGQALMRDGEYRQLKKEIRQILSEFSDSQREIIEALYGLNDGITRTNIEVAEFLGLSRQYVSRTHTMVLDRLRDPKYSDRLREHDR